MIPLATPRDGELVNLSQIVKYRSHPKDDGLCDECLANGLTEKHGPDDRSCTVYFSDGRSEIYTGEAGRRMHTEMHMMLKLFRDSMRAIFEPPAITAPTPAPRGFRGFKG